MIDKIGNVKMIRRGAPKRIEGRQQRKLLANEDGSLVADFAPGFITLHTDAGSIVMSWREAVEFALSIAVHARLPM